MPIFAPAHPVDLSATRDVFVSALRFATSTCGPCPPFIGDELKTSAREQVEYMLEEDEGMPLVTADNEVKSVAKLGLSKIFSSFEKQLSSLLLDSQPEENEVLHSLADLEWMCNIIPKMDLLKDFVSYWTEISTNVLEVVEDEKLNSSMWELKAKLIEVVAKAFEAVGYGSVILAAHCRVQLIKTWLPYLRKIKPLLNLNAVSEDLWQGIEGAIVSLVLALPSSDQADILADWIKKIEQYRYPDLSEAFEIWCYRSKSARRRLEVVGVPINAAVSL